MRATGRPLIALLALGLVPAAVLAATPSPSPTPQSFFRDALLKDSKTASPVKRLLSTGAGFVDPNPVFADLTGDGKADAVVAVDTGGAAGSIAAYVFSTDGAKSQTLRAVYRNQQLYRVSAKVRGTTLLLDTPDYSPGDELCCPQKIRRREYAWDAKKTTMVHRFTTTFAGPGAPQQAPTG